MTTAKLFWHIIPLHTPRVLRTCSRCHARCRFISTDKFRINRQQQHIDVWLIYRCEQCENTWNCAIVRRMRQKQIDTGLYANFVHNDRDTAWRYAFDHTLPADSRMRHESTTSYRIQAEPGHIEQKDMLRIQVTFTYPMTVRLDSLLKTGLKLPQSQIRKMLRSGGVRVSGQETNKTPKLIRRDCALEIDLRQI